MLFGKKNEFDLSKAETITEPEVEKYVRKDSETGFTEDKQEISRLRATHKYDMVANNLLGEFSIDGHYSIEPHIMAELIAMPKYIVENKNGVITASAEYKDGTLFSFTISAPQKLPDGSALCVLKLNETIEKANGYIQDTISTVVGSYCFKFDEHYDARRMIVFNLREKKEEDAKIKSNKDSIGKWFVSNDGKFFKLKDTFLVDILSVRDNCILYETNIELTYLYGKEIGNEEIVHTIELFISKSFEKAKLIKI